MLPIDVVHAIEYELRKGELSQRKIAAKLGVSRATVNAIANGTRKNYGINDDLSECVEELPATETKPSRCPDCGEMVFLPCNICRVRRYRQGRLAIARLQRCNNEKSRTC